MSAHAHLAKLISDAKHPVPCMNKASCDALAAHLVQKFKAIDPINRDIVRILEETCPPYTEIYDK